MKLLALVLLIPFLASCTNSAFTYPTPTAEFTAKRDKTLALITPDPSITIYEGLPHQVWRQEQLKIEIKTKANQKRHGFHFYLPAHTDIPAKQRKQLTALLSAPDNFPCEAIPKLCGGFHPDYSVLLREGADTQEFQICTGCSNVRIYRNGELALKAEPHHRLLSTLKKLLAPYSTQCPPEENDAKPPADENPFDESLPSAGITPLS